MINRVAATCVLETWHPPAVGAVVTSGRVILATASRLAERAKKLLAALQIRLSIDIGTFTGLSHDGNVPT